MNKNTPLLIFTGLAVAAAGTLGAVLTGTYPGAAPAPQAVEAPAQPAAPAAPAASAGAPAAPATETAAPAASTAEAQVAVAPAQDAPQPAPEAKAAEAQPPAATGETPAAPAGNPDVPAFDTINVLPGGEAVIAGRARPGSEVIIKFAGAEVGRATAATDGSFAFVPEKPLPVGAGALTLETTVDGKLLVSEDEVAIVVDAKKPALVAKVEPEAPTKVVQVPASGPPVKEVQLSAVDYDAEGNIVFQGRVTPGGTVRFYVDNQVIGDVKADEQGNWLFKGTSPIAAGTHMLRADEIDATGKVLSRAELPFLREEPEKVIAAAEAADATAADPGQSQAAAQPDQVQTKSEVTPAAASGEPQAVVAPVTAETGTAEVVVAGATATKPSRIIIQPGNNLWRISREVYGKGKMFTVIWEANRDQIKNPNRIYPGQILTAPQS